MALTALALTAAIAGAPLAHASATTTASPAPDPETTARVDASQVEGDAAHFTRAEIAQAVRQGLAREEDGTATEADQQLEEDLIAESESYLTDADVTVAHLIEDDVRVDVALVETQRVDHLEVEIASEADGGAVTVTSSASEDPNAADVTTAGPGMGTWQWHADGDYVLKIYNNGRFVAQGLFLWQRNKLANDGSGAYDWYSYTRRGFGQPENIFGDDWQIQRLVISSYPYDNIDSEAEGLLSWSGMKPGEDFTKCDAGTSFSTTMEVKATDSFGFSFTPQNCSDYDVWFNGSIPGSYRLTYDQGNWVKEGNRSIAYNVAWKVDQGTAGSQHDFQRITVQPDPTGGNEATCGVYDQSANCTTF